MLYTLHGEKSPDRGPGDSNVRNISMITRFVYSVNALPRNKVSKRLNSNIVVRAVRRLGMGFCRKKRPPLAPGNLLFGGAASSFLYFPSATFRALEHCPINAGEYRHGTRTILLVLAEHQKKIFSIYSIAQFAYRRRPSGAIAFLFSNTVCV